MTEQEAAKDFARKLFGPRREQELEDEPGPSTDETEAKAEPGPRAEPIEDPEQAHNRFIGDLLGGGGAKREADEQFLCSMHPPTKGGHEWEWVRSTCATTRC
jgi:hypothetical protein